MGSCEVNGMIMENILLIILVICSVIGLTLILKYDHRPNHNPSWYEIHNYYIRDKD